MTLPASLVSLPLVVTPPNNWLTIDKLIGVLAADSHGRRNPTGLPPGNYPTQLLDRYQSRADVGDGNVTLVVQNPTPTLQLTSPTPSPYYTSRSRGARPRH